MYRLLMLAILATTLPEFGGIPRMLTGCRNPDCVRRVAAISKVATKVEWKPIVIFKKEAAQFK